MASRTRAGNGRAQPYEKENGRWECFVAVGAKPDGSLDRRKVSAKTRKECLDKVRNLERLRDLGAVPEAGQRWTVASWLDHWLESIVGPTTKPKTAVSYETNVRLYLVAHLGGVRLDRLRPEHVDRMYADMKAAGKGSATVQSTRRTLRAALNRAVDRGHIPNNPVTTAVKPRHEEPEVEPLTRDEARLILAAAPHEPNGIAWIVHLSLGLRRGEVLALRWSDVDLAAGTLRVQQTLQRLSWKHGCGDAVACSEGRHRDKCPPRCTGHARHCLDRLGGGLVFDSPKSRAGRRTLDIPPPLVDQLRAQRSTQIHERLTAGSEWDDHDLVFAQPNGKPLDPDNQSKAWKAFLERTGIRVARLHDARHTAATLLLLQGVDPRTVMYVMGWSEASMTKRYQHVVPELRRAAMERMTEALWDEVPPDRRKSV
jgi:integrase